MAEPEKKVDEETPRRYPRLEALRLPGPYDYRYQVFRGSLDGGIRWPNPYLWIAATASVRGHPLVTCDRDHVRIAPELGAEVVYLRPPV